MFPLFLYFSPWLIPLFCSCHWEKFLFLVFFPRVDLVFIFQYTMGYFWCWFVVLYCVYFFFCVCFGVCFPYLCICFLCLGSGVNSAPFHRLLWIPIASRAWETSVLFKHRSTPRDTRLRSGCSRGNKTRK